MDQFNMTDDLTFALWQMPLYMLQELVEIEWKDRVYQGADPTRFKTMYAEAIRVYDLRR